MEKLFWAYSEVRSQKSGSFVQIWHKCFVWNFSIKFRTFSVCYGWLAFLIYYWLMNIFFKKTAHSYGKNAKSSPRNFLYCVCFDTLLQRACYREESAKSRGLHGNVVTWATWVRPLCGSNFYVGWVGYVAQNIFYLGHNFFVSQIYFCVGPKFLHRVFFAWISLFY